jgi:hypothetical protein
MHEDLYVSTRGRDWVGKTQANLVAWLLCLVS